MVISIFTAKLCFIFQDQLLRIKEFLQNQKEVEILLKGNWKSRYCSEVIIERWCRPPL